MTFGEYGPVPEVGDRVFYTARVGIQEFVSGGSVGEIATFGPAVVTMVNPGATVDLFVMFADQTFQPRGVPLADFVAGAEQAWGCWSVDHVRW